jgi:hypothetical protein
MEERRAVVQPVASGVLARDSERAGRDVDADTRRIGELRQCRQQETSTAGSDVQDVQLSVLGVQSLSVASAASANVTSTPIIGQDGIPRVSRSAPRCPRAG